MKNKEAARSVLWRPSDQKSRLAILCRACDFGGFRVNTPSVESIVNDLSNGGNVGVNIHSITCS
jgi:hypothetical protein